jgi:hypothetical protein
VKELVKRQKMVYSADQFVKTRIPIGVAVDTWCIVLHGVYFSLPIGSKKR